MKFRRLFFLLLLIVPTICSAQQITYTQPENEDSRSINFEIIGKVSGNFLVYKNIRNRHTISVYDNGMSLKEKAYLDFIPDKTINTDFIAYPDFAYIIYEFQKRGIVHCMAVKIDGNGKKLNEPVELDTTHVGVFGDNKIYNTIYSENKQKIMVYKIQKKYEKFNFATILFNSQLERQHLSRMELPYEERKNVLSDFFVDNEGTFIFTEGIKQGNREYISKLFLATKSPQSDKFEMNEVVLNKIYLDNVNLKIDNANRRYVVTSFYYGGKRSDIDGFFTIIWDKQTNKPFAQNTTTFSDELKREAKSGGHIKFAFNDYFIRNIILKKDGGFILSAEDFTSQSRGNPWNRMDYLYGYPYMSASDYYFYSPSSSWYNYRQRTNTSLTRYYYNNIVVINVDKDGKLVWTNVIHKDQFDDGDDNFLSYQQINIGGELHFLFNEVERRNQLIADQSITPDGKLTRNPTLKSLDKGYEFMPKFAKQVSAKQIIVPCIYRNYICFAKIDYE
ncbi:MAG: hypothetical protein M3004_06435 [Bacteroidota bacterium]|nr:hypothetical protein [Bacteroidota bacterium]